MVFLHCVVLAPIIGPLRTPPADGWSTPSVLRVVFSTLVGSQELKYA